MSYASKAYAETNNNTAVSSANSRELLVIVYERILDNLKIGKREIEENRYGIQPFTKASDLINLGLLATLDMEKGGAIARNLSSVYKWSLSKIVDARVKKSPEIVQEVIDVLTPLKDAWIEIKRDY